MTTITKEQIEQVLAAIKVPYLEHNLAEVESVNKIDINDFRDFHISVDNYYTTHSPENRELSELIYHQLKNKGDIETKNIEQAYDSVKKMFLPDRYVKGECPRCGAKNQYGDNCESCGASYTPAEVKNPISTISNTTPITKKSLHYFFNLSKYTEMLKQWTQAGHLQKQVVNKLDEWLKSELKPWDISRDEPYFGFKIPGTDDKYFYVWLDAPIGYMAGFKNYCQNKNNEKKNTNVNFDDYWKKDSTKELYHFVGKDIIYFHGLFWPAMLHGAGFRTPTAIFTHGFLTIDGKKMSKSRGTFIKARTYLDHLNPEYLRYYFAAKLSNDIDDLDLNFNDFTLRINADLVGKVVNIASRCAGFINKRFDGMLAKELENKTLYEEVVAAEETIAELYESREFSRAVREIMKLADRINQYIDEKKPWVLAKQEGQEQQVQAVCTMGLNLFRLLMIYLKPILPIMAEKVETFLNTDPLTWDSLNAPLLNHKINPFKPLLVRVEQQQIDAILEQEKVDLLALKATSASRHVTS